MADTIEELIRRPYGRLLTPDVNGGYVADVLELSGCFSEGETPDEAIDNLEDAMRGWFEVALEQGRTIPEPLDASEFNGRVLLRLPRSLHRECVRRASADGISLNQWLVEAVGERLGAEGFADKLIDRVHRSVPTLMYEQREVTTRYIIAPGAKDMKGLPGAEEGNYLILPALHELEKQNG